jgi:lysophospholipase L1-like esterase
MPTRETVKVVQLDPNHPEEWPSFQGTGWHMLAEGDSWFTISKIGLVSNLLLSLSLRRTGSELLSLAYPGDTIRRMSQVAANPRLKQVLCTKGFAYRFDAILLSGGGNDVIDAANDIIGAPTAGASGTQPGDYIRQPALSQILADVQQGYRRIIAMRDHPDSLSQGRPVFIHTYDYPTARPAPATVFGAGKVAGPWLYPALQPLGLSDDMARRIVDLVFDQLAEALLALDCLHGPADKRLPNVHVVNTRQTLTRALPGTRGDSKDWDNEIHPDTQGYAKLGARLAEGIEAIMLPA